MSQWRWRSRALDGQGPVSIPTAGGFTCGQELVGDFGQGTDHHHRPLPPDSPALDNSGDADDRRSIFDRRTAELHDDRLHAETAT